MSIETKTVKTDISFSIAEKLSEYGKGSIEENKAKMIENLEDSVLNYQSSVDEAIDEIKKLKEGEDEDVFNLLADTLLAPWDVITNHGEIHKNK